MVAALHVEDGRTETPAEPVEGAQFAIDVLSVCDVDVEGEKIVPQSVVPPLSLECSDVGSVGLAHGRVAAVHCGGLKQCYERVNKNRETQAGRES